jgi:pimeloyl-ACP methyl ester carboxylesterase
MLRALHGLVAFAAALIVSAQAAYAQSADPNAALANEVIVAQPPGRSISALVTHQPGATKLTHAIALFPGSPGYMNLRVEGSAIRFGLGGNFLVRARRHFIEDGFLTVVIDAPSDNQVNFWHSYRASDRYGDDVRAVVDAVSKKFGALDWTCIGTSEGSVSAVHAARMVSPPAKRVALTASLVTPSFAGPGVRVSDVRQVDIPVLWVHHRNDPCSYTQYSRVKQYAEETKTPLVTVTGASGIRGDPCMAFTQHGFVGMEIMTIKAILSWIRTGQVPPDVSE